ncbi:low-density lipoprotein receptor class A domain-containing protein 2 [Spea bombifrons]|uniref:low-density lipoprotein receptor class A domain-containing protein 2 n=1 Tax=Spea bombifrons TaxID=233779 RepID=UPI00234B65CF|nr:low-density lipoprotein receptor class A domain-containing protein 2 [Spea bombifrons]
MSGTRCDRRSRKLQRFENGQAHVFVMMSRKIRPMRRQRGFYAVPPTLTHNGVNRTPGPRGLLTPGSLQGLFTGVNHLVTSGNMAPAQQKGDAERARIRRAFQSDTCPGPQLLHASRALSAPFASESLTLKRNVKMAPDNTKTLQLLSQLFVLLSFMMQVASPIGTVNLVDFCGQTIKGDGMIVNSHGESRKYYFVTMGTDCRLTMQASASKDKVQFQFRFFLVYSLLRMSNSPTPGPGANGAQHADTTKGPGTVHDPCNAGSYVQFYDGKDLSSEPLGTPLCGKTIPRPVLSTGNYLTLRLVTRGQQPRVDFVGDFTSFRIGLNVSECSSEPYFHCQNGKCIPSSLVCDSKNIDNCGDGSDQSGRPPANCMPLSADGRAGKSRGLMGTGIPGEILSTQTATSALLEAASLNQSCGGAGKHKPHGADSGHHHGPTADRRSYTSLLYLYVILGLVVGVAILFWCCWSPGWFIWRSSVCRFLPCCNSFCAACHLCMRSCVLKDKTRPGKVTPQDTTAMVPV